MTLRANGSFRPFEERHYFNDDSLKRLTSWLEKNCTPDDLQRCVAYDYTVKELLADLDKVVNGIEDAAWGRCKNGY